MKKVIRSERKKGDHGTHGKGRADRTMDWTIKALKMNHKERREHKEMSFLGTNEI